MNDCNDFARLQRIGLSPTLQRELALLPPPGDDEQLYRITEVQRGGLTLHDGGHEHPARALPALMNRLRDEADALAVGDWVFAATNTLGERWVQRRVPPRNQIARRLHDGRDKIERVVIVSNVDTALLVMGLDADYNPRRLERWLALVRMAGVGALVVLTKADLCADTPERMREVQAMLPHDAAVVAVNALDADAASSLQPWLVSGQTLVLLGASGTGKSTLTNTLAGAPLQATGANRSGDNRGRHTTTARSLHCTDGGACIIDTPGLRTLRLDGDAEALGSVFGDIAGLALQCRFRDCGHGTEPGCAVREGVPAERLRSYQKLLREARRDSLSLLEKQQLQARWKVHSRAARERDKARRG